MAIASGIHLNDGRVGFEQAGRPSGICESWNVPVAEAWRRRISDRHRFACHLVFCAEVFQDTLNEADLVRRLARGWAT